MSSASHSTPSPKSQDLASWSYAAGAISIIMYTAGLLYCAWGIAEIETGLFKYKQTPRSFWEVMFAFDVTIYVSGIVSSLAMVIGVLKVSYIVNLVLLCASASVFNLAHTYEAILFYHMRIWLLPWILVSIIILAKQFLQMLIVLIVYRHEYFALLISMAQVLVFLSQVAFIVAVIMNYFQMKPKRRLVMLQRYPSISSQCSMRMPLYFTPVIRHKF